MNIGIGISLANYRPVPTAPLEDLDAAIAALFGSGEVGAWYDPSDSSTVFQDAAGTTPAGVGDPVGLILDKSKGLTLGSELVTNGTFDVDEADTSDWISSTSWTSIGASVGGVFQVATATANGRQVSAITLVAGKTYKITGQYRKVSGGGTALIGMSSSSSGSTFISFPTTSSSSFVDMQLIFVAPQSSMYVVAGHSASGIGVAEFDNISVRELPGNHATQTTSAARPVLQQSGGLYYLDFDGVDDWLSVATLPAATQNTLGIARYFAPAMANSGLFYFMDTATTGIGLFHYTTPRYGFNTWNNDLWGEDAEHRGATEVDVAYFVNGNPATSGVTLRVNGSAISLSQVQPTSVSRNMSGGAKIGTGAVTGSFHSDVNVYGVVVVNRTLTAAEITDLETYLAAKSGVTL